MRGLFERLFGCRHEDMSWPITIKNRNGSRRTYRVCLDCGKERDWNWSRMRYEKPVGQKFQERREVELWTVK